MTPLRSDFVRQVLTSSSYGRMEGGHVTLGGDGGVVIEPGNTSRVGNWSRSWGVHRHRCVIEILARDLTRDLAWSGGHVTLGGDGGVVIEAGDTLRVGNWGHSWGVHRRL